MKKKLWKPDLPKTSAAVRFDQDGTLTLLLPNHAPNDSFTSDCPTIRASVAALVNHPDFQDLYDAVIARAQQKSMLSVSETPH